ncbi:MAG: IPT/TIG domain-containing protein [Xenococcaceae cyanobacterium]
MSSENFNQENSEKEKSGEETKRKNLDEHRETIKKLVTGTATEEFRELIGSWVQLIAYGDDPLLVEMGAEKLRASDQDHEAVLPLIDKFKKKGLFAVPSKELQDKIIEFLSPVAYKESMIKLINRDPLEKSDRDNIKKWLDSFDQKKWLESVEELDEVKTLKKEYQAQGWDDEEYSRNIAYLRIKKELEIRELNVRKRIARQLADMSDRRFIEEYGKTQEQFENIRKELNKHAVPALIGLLSQEDDIDIRETMVRILANVSTPEAVDALVRSVTGEERIRAERQKLLSEYYLEPSKQRSEEAANLLQEAVGEAKRTLRLLQWLNIGVFLVGVVLLIGGVIIGVFNEDVGARWIGGVSGVLGGTSIVTQLIRDPLNRIQNAMADLIQLETAFTSFIWELNLNGTYIQSQYVSKGELADSDINQTVNRIEQAMNSAMNLVSVYTEEGSQRIVTRINNLLPPVGALEDTITIFGQHLQGDSSQKKERTGIIAINHTPIRAENVSWNSNEVKFKLPSKIPQLDTQEGTIWVSLLIDGMETNSLPFHVVNQSS